MTSWEEWLKQHQEEFDALMKEFNERMVKLELSVELFGEKVEEIDRQMKEWKKKFPGS